MDGERLQCAVTPEAIKHKGTLQCLSSNVSLGNAGCIALTKAMQYNSTLQTLTIDVENKEMEVAGCIALAKAVKQNGTLQPLTINHDDTEIGQDRIADLSACCDSALGQLGRTTVPSAAPAIYFHAWSGAESMAWYG